MKKLAIATLIAMAFGTTAMAEESYIKLEGVHYNYTSQPNDQQGYNLQLGTSIGNGFKIDGKNEWRHEDNSGKTSTRIEGGLTYEAKVADRIAASLRTSLGEKYSDNTNYGYYTVEPGVAYALTDVLKLKASYRFRDAINDSVADRTNTYKVGADYDLTKSTFLTGSIGRTTGDKEYTSLQAGIGIRF
jgi:opacity protein-like surface antigen